MLQWDQHGEKLHFEWENFILKPNRISEIQIPWHKPEKNVNHPIYPYEKTNMVVSN